MVNHRLTPAGEISDIVATVDCSDRYYAANAASAARPLVPLFPAAATTVTPAATTLLTAVVKVGKTLSQFGCVPPPSTGDVSRRILMIWALFVCAHWIPAMICDMFPEPALLRTLSLISDRPGATPFAEGFTPAATAIPATCVP